MCFIMTILLSWVKICHLRLRCVFLSVLVLEWSAILQVLCLSHQMESASASIRPCSTDDWFLLSNRRGGEGRRYFELLILIIFNLFLVWQNGLVIYIPLPCQFCWCRFCGCLPVIFQLLRSFSNDSTQGDDFPATEWVPRDASLTWNVVSLQSTSRPGCIIGLKPIDCKIEVGHLVFASMRFNYVDIGQVNSGVDLCHDSWRQCLLCLYFRHFAGYFRDFLLVLLYQNWQNVQLIHVFQELLISGRKAKQSKQEDGSTVSSANESALLKGSFQERFYLVIVEKMDDGSSVVHMWIIAVSSRGKIVLMIANHHGFPLYWFHHWSAQTSVSQLLNARPMLILKISQQAEVFHQFC